MKRAILFLMAAVLVFTVCPLAWAGWGSDTFERDYDSIGVYTIQDAAAGSFSSYDTISAWTIQKNDHAADDVMKISIKDIGGSNYTSMHYEAYPTTTPHADSCKGYVVLQQSLMGLTWVDVGSVSVTTASTAAEADIDLLKMPLFRFRTQGATATDKSTGVNVSIKIYLFK
jgi:hypothetical protein